MGGGTCEIANRRSHRRSVDTTLDHLENRLRRLALVEGPQPREVLEERGDADLGREIDGPEIGHDAEKRDAMLHNGGRCKCAKYFRHDKAVHNSQ
jgi:hypothetical protein